MTEIKITEFCGYAVSIFLVLSDLMHWLNQNAAACGVFLGVATYFTNLYFQRKNLRNIANRHIGELERRRNNE